MESLETQTTDSVGYSVGDVVGDVNEAGRVRVYDGVELTDVPVWRLNAETDHEKQLLTSLKLTAVMMGFSPLRTERVRPERKGYVVPGALQLGRVITHAEVQL